MKSDIHPQYFDQANITCACGTTFNLGSTKENTSTESCSNCHPFYTGKQKKLDSGRAEKFRAKLEKSAQVKETTVSKKEKAIRRKATQDAKKAK